MRRPRFATLLHFSLLAAFFIAVLGTSAFAADPRIWGGPPSNRTGIPIRQGHHIEWQKAGFRGPDGSTVVAWSDARTGNRDVYAQRILPDGTKAWGATGRQIVSVEYRQEDPEVVWVNGGWIIAWIDFRTDTLGDVYAQKLDNNGNPLWNPDGVAIDVLPFSAVLETTVRAVHDGSGGAIIAWEDARNNAGDIFAQHINSTGAVTWASVLAVTLEPSDQKGITADADGSGNMLLAWYEIREVGGTIDVYAAKITADGQLPWGRDGILICGANGRQDPVKLCPDGSGGCYLAWTDRRFGGADIYMQRMNSDGQPQWAVNGITLCDSAGDQDEARVAISENSGFQDGCIVTWTDKRVNNDISEIYVQKINNNGVIQWTGGGVKVCGDAAPGGGGDTRDAPRITSDLMGGLICSWDDTRGSNDPRQYDLYTARVHSDGNLDWTGSCGVLVGNGPNQQAAPLLRLDNGSGVFVIYTDTRSGSQLLRYQRLDLFTGAPTLHPDTAQIVYGIDGNGIDPESAEMIPGRVGVVWQDTRFGITGGPALFYQIVDIGTDSMSHFVKELNGDTLVPDNETYSAYAQSLHRVCPDQQGGFFVSFIDNRFGGQRVRLTRVDSQGDIACSRAGELVFSRPETQDQTKAYCAPDGEGGCYVAWQGYNAEFYLDVYVMRMNSNCQPADGWTEPVRLTLSDVEDELVEGLVPITDGCCAVVWTQGDQMSSDIGGARVCPNGDVTWNRLICGASNVQNWPSVCSDGAGGAYFAWADKRTPVHDRDVYAQHILPNGDEAWSANGILVVSDTLEQTKPVLAADSAANLYVVWEDFRNSADVNLYGQKLSSEGTRLWPVAGRALCLVSGEQTDVQLHVEWDNGLYAVWDDFRGYFKHLYGTHINELGSETDPGYWLPTLGGTVCEYYQWQFNSTLADDAHGGVVCSWEDLRATGKDQLRNIWCNWINDGTVSITEIRNAAIPMNAELGQNYPNPFNPTTRFTFAIPQTGRVEIAVYNSLGQHVEQLADQVMTAGRYEVAFDAGHLASGIYFYRLKVGSFTDVKKMMLLR